MVLATPGPLLTPPPSSSPPKTPFRSYSAQIRSQNEEKNYDIVFDNSILFHKNDLLRMTYFRIPGVPVLHFVPWHRGSGCLGAAAPVTGAAADEYNLNVVDCTASVTVARVNAWPFPCTTS